MNTTHKTHGIDMNISHSNLTNYLLQFEGRKNSLRAFSNLESIDSRKLVVDHSKLFHTDHNCPIALDITGALVYFDNIEVFGANQNRSIVVVKGGSKISMINSIFMGNDVQSKKSSITIECSIGVPIML